MFARRIGIVYARAAEPSKRQHKERGVEDGSRQAYQQLCLLAWVRGEAVGRGIYRVWDIKKATSGSSAMMLN